MNNYENAMSRVTISMPDQMSDWVDAQVAGGRYGNVSEYFRDLVRHDQERREGALAELRAMISIAEQSGVSGRPLSDLMTQVEDRLRSDGRL